MKKSLIVTGGASLAFAAMPIVGAFAATSTSFTDTLTVTVPGGCTLEDATADNSNNPPFVAPGTYTDRAFSATIPTGTYKELGNGFNGQTGKTMRIACNVSSGNWTITAQASSGALAGKTGAAVGHSIAPGVATDGNTSAWAIKSNASTGTGTANPYSAYKAYAVDTDTDGDTENDASVFLTGGADAATPVTFNPSYRVYVSPTQEPGDYEGTVTYTIAMD